MTARYPKTMTDDEVLSLIVLNIYKVDLETAELTGRRKFKIKPAFDKKGRPSIGFTTIINAGRSSEASSSGWPDRRGLSRTDSRFIIGTKTTRTTVGIT